MHGVDVKDVRLDFGGFVGIIAQPSGGSCVV